MSTQVVLFEPIKLPDPRRPAMLPSLPEWAERSSVAVRLELQMTPDGKGFERQDVLVLPANLMPTPEQKREMIAHQEGLRSFLRDTPALSVTAETRVATSVSKLLTVLAGERKSDLIEEARSEVYLDVLDDTPCWAVEAAVKRWFRHDCGTDERGKPHNYTFAPDPGTLRKIAQRECHEFGARIGKLQRVIDARLYIDCTKQLEDGRAAMLGLKIGMKDGRAETLTFAQAIELGRGTQAAREAAE
jgi:hypothetical protein